MGLALALAPIAAGADSCKGPEAPSNTHLVLDVSQPPLAQTYGCPAGKWFLSVLDRKIADDPNQTPDQKAKQAKKICEDPNVAKKYPIGGYWP